MGIVEDKFVKWVARQLSDITPEGAIDRMELWHIIEGDHGEKLDTFQVDTEREPLELATEIWQVAEQDLGTRYAGQSNRYTVQAFRGSVEPERSYSFLLQGGVPRWQMLGNSTEPPTEKGMISQSMRERDDLHRLLVQLTTSQTGPLMRENHELREQLQVATNANLQLAVKAQELLDTSHQRQLEQAREEAKERRHDQLMTMIMGLAPALLAQLLGAKGMGGNMQDNLVSQSLTHLFRNLSEEELVKVVTSLKPENQVMVMQLYEASKQQYMKEQEQKPPVLRDKDLPQEEPEEEPVKH